MFSGALVFVSHVCFLFFRCLPGVVSGSFKKQFYFFDFGNFYSSVVCSLAPYVSRGILQVLRISLRDVSL